MKRSVAYGVLTLAVLGLIATMTAQAPIEIRENPFTAFRFSVEIEGFAAASFQEVSGLASETEVIEFQDAEGLIHERPGRTIWGDVVLKRGVDSRLELWEWRQAIIDGNTDRKSISIVLHDAQANEIARWGFVNAWPSKISLGSLQGGSNAVLVEELTIVHEGMVRVK